MKPCLNLTLNKLYQQFSLSGSLRSLIHSNTYSSGRSRPSDKGRGGGGAVIQTLRSALDPPLYSTYIAKDNKLKILAVKVLTYVQDPSDLKKKLIIFISNQQSCFFRHKL